MKSKDGVVSLVAYGASIAGNFGGPSILFGAYALWREVFGEVRLTYLERSENPELSAELGPPAVYFSPEGFTRTLLREGLAVKRWRGKGASGCSDPRWLAIQEADALVDLWGILYATPLGRTRFRRLLIPPPLLLAAHFLDVPAVKYTASFGPILDWRSRLAARFHLRPLTRLVLCRERQSLDWLTRVGIPGRQLALAPDSAVCMMPEEWDWKSTVSFERPCKPVLGISVSWQMMRQWRSEIPYEEILLRAVKRSTGVWGWNVLLIPNEVAENRPNDSDVAKRIQERSGGAGQVQLLNTRFQSAPRVKHVIGCMDLFLGSRYHSIVAGCSSGVPTVVLGWHHKYRELLTHYASEKFLLTADDCSAEKMEALLEQCRANSVRIRDSLRALQSEVRRNAVAAAVRFRSVVFEAQ